MDSATVNLFVRERDYVDFINGYDQSIILFFHNRDKANFCLEQMHYVLLSELVKPKFSHFLTDKNRYKVLFMYIEADECET